MICPQCQAMNEQSSAFCGHCGTSLTRLAPAPDPRDSAPSSTILAGSGSATSGTPGRSQPLDASGPAPYQYAPGAQQDQYAPGPPGYPYGPGTPASQSAPGAAAPAGAFHLDLRRLSRVDQTVGGASLIVLISVFLPWFGFGALGESISVSGTTAHGYLVIVVILALLLIGYLVLLSGWEEFPVNLPIAHAPLLLIGTGLQLLLVLIGFFDVPVAGLNWEFGAYLALLAAVAAAGPLIVPAIRSWQASR